MPKKKQARPPIILEGVMRGRKTIELDEDSFLPDGYRVKLHVILEPDEALRLAAGAWADMTPEQEADLEETLSHLRGRPVQIPKIERPS
jgi:hypothetical protein